MGSDTKAFNIFIIIFQMKVIYQQNDFFQHNYAHLNGKLIQMFFGKSHESKFSIVIEMEQLIHVQYIIKYFIKFCNYLNHLKSIQTFCSIFVHVLFSHKYTLESFNINQEM
jgi:hypothetical protein